MATKLKDYDCTPNCTGSVFLKDDYLNDLSKYYTMPNSYISNGNISSAIDAVTVDSLMKNYLKPYIDDYMAQQVKTMIATPSPMHTTSTPVQTIDPIAKYPITNKAYAKLSPGYAFPDDLREICNNVAVVHAHLAKLPIDTEQIFIAKLEDVRPKEDEVTDEMKKLGIYAGNTLDPWFRNISLNREKFTTLRKQGNDYSFMGMHQYQVKVGSNHEEIIIFWGMESSIKSKPIYIILYTILKMGYIAKSKKRAHLDLIHPHNCSIAANYDYC